MGYSGTWRVEEAVGVVGGRPQQLCLPLLHVGPAQGARALAGHAEGLGPRRRLHAHGVVLAAVHHAGLGGDDLGLRQGDGRARGLCVPGRGVSRDSQRRAGTDHASKPALVVRVSTKRHTQNSLTCPER